MRLISLLLLLSFIISPDQVLPAVLAEESSRERIVDWLRSKQDSVIIHSQAELNNHLASLADQLQERTHCFFAGALRNKGQAAMQLSNWHDFIQGYTFTQYPDGSIGFKFTYKDSAKMLAAANHRELMKHLSPREVTALAEAQKRVAQLIQPGMDDIEKVRVLHDDLIMRSDYQDGGSGDATTLLLEHRGVCEAYSRTFHLLLTLADIPCHIVVGDCGTLHAWNLVQVKGEWYHVDVTWDDPRSLDGQSILTHRYFLLNDKQLALDHSWEQGSLPISAVKDSLFFRSNGRYFTSYHDLWQDVSRAVHKGDTEYEAYLECFGSRKLFLHELQKASINHPGVLNVLSWREPNTSEGVLSLTLDHSGSPPRTSTEIKKYIQQSIRKSLNWFQSLNFREKIQSATQELNHEIDTGLYLEKVQLFIQKNADLLLPKLQKIKSIFNVFTSY